MTVVSAVIVTTHVAEMSVQAPDQPSQGDPVFGVAVSVTTVPLAKELPAGLAATVPFPFVLTTSL